MEVWQKKTARLQELTDWLFAATKELKGVPATDERWPVYRRIEAAAKRLEGELPELAEQQDEDLARHLERTGPLTLEQEDRTQLIAAAHSSVAGGQADLLPADILRVWRVASALEGSVALGGERTALRFGDAEQIRTVKLAPKKARKGAVTGEADSLFGKE